MGWLGCRTGRKPRLTGEQLREIEAWVRACPDREKDGVVCWRCADLRDRIKDRFEVTLHERSVRKLLKKLDFSSISGRPQHPQSDPQAQETFKKRARIGVPPVAVETDLAIVA